MSEELHASFTRKYSGGPAICADHLSIGNGITVLFGASGSGKTTVLRCLAGLERPDEGTIRFGKTTWFDATQNFVLATRMRNIGFVPQDYALFSHLTVESNIAYGLSALPKPEQKQRVAQAVNWLGLDGLEQRRPSELSGGQQQRVALARAVVRQPGLLLLDEPLAALDSPTRLRLRGELRILLLKLGIPTILVTHDRIEALALGDRIVVLADGHILQSGSVGEVFNHPASVAVAGIVGTETVLAGRVLQVSDSLATVVVGDVQLTALSESLPSGTTTVYVCIRAEDIILSKDEAGHSSPRNRLAAVVRSITPEGPLVRIELDCGFPLSALLTKQACEELALQEHTRLLALIKAPQIHLIPSLGRS